MAKDREIVCEYYTCANAECKKGRICNFKRIQTCDKYLPKKGASPRRVNNRKKKLEKIDKKENKIFI